jgi:hypothetical protein
VLIRDVVDEVGADAARFFFLARSADSQMEFDLELAKRQSAENPVYYVQYAHARSWHHRNAGDRGLRRQGADPSRPDPQDAGEPELCSSWRSGQPTTCRTTRRSWRRHSTCSPRVPVLDDEQMPLSGGAAAAVRGGAIVWRGL